jgi:tRNA pseudouridine(38-40) synthase
MATQAATASTGAPGTRAHNKIKGGGMTPTKTFLLVVEYDGTNYFGFQRQEGTERVDVSAGPPPKKKPRQSTNTSASGRAARRAGAPPITIQDQLETALVRLTGNSLAELRVRGAGRTDKGVHATGQVVAFDYHHHQNADDADDADDGTSSDSIDKGAKNRKKKMQKQHQDASLFQDASPLEELWQIRRAINSRLPKDIAVRSCRLLPPPPPGGRPFEARRDVKNKRYTYRIRFHRKRVISTAVDDGLQRIISPICQSGPNTLRRAHDRSNVWICPWALDVELIRKACNSLQGQHDFSSFVVKCDRRNRDNLIHLKTFSVSFKDAIDIEDDDSNNNVDIAADDIPCNATFTLEAGGFRRQMVRRLIGFVVDVARGQYNLGNIEDILKGIDDAAQQVNAAPACGLCLSKVDYKII